MAKVFRLHTEGKDTIRGWGDSSKYSSNVIYQIQDPNGGSAAREITSIPSPFARMDLVKNAFKIVADSGNLEGDTIYHKMVSDSLDVGQIFFEIDKLQEQIEIIEWDSKNDLQELVESDILGQKLLGNTYNIFLKQDKQAFNFGKLKSIYLLNFTRGTSRVNIIGATSPATLFFSPANNLEYVSEISFGCDTPFDGSFAPLFKRDFEYQKYWYLLQKSIQNFATIFPEVNTYLNKSFEKLDEYKQKDIHNLQANDLNNLYSPLSVANNNNTAEVLGYSLYKKKSNPGNIEKKSDFVIKSPKTKNELKPLVLPVDRFTQSYQYTYDKWEEDTQVPYYDNAPIDERRLPKDGCQYPYLTISDFLEDTIIEMPYELNNDSFFDGNHDKKKGKSYLLPLTELFFNYFSPKELMTSSFEGKKMIEIQQHTTSVNVILRIPVKKGYVEYKRIYFDGNNPDISKNMGAVLKEKKFGLGVFPLLEFKNGEMPHYRIALFDKGENSTRLEFRNNGRSADENSVKRVVRKEKDLGIAGTCGVETYVVENPINRIVVKVGNYKGVILPKLKSKSGSSVFHFAVDFGTTNTHVEYKTEGSNRTKAFNISSEDIQLVKLHKDYGADLDIKSGFNHNFLPDIIGKDEEYSFPMRTAFSERREINYEMPHFTLADGNIPFEFEKEQARQYNKPVITNLKWDAQDKGRVKLFLENIFLMLRNKVLLNGGDLTQTKITWFYPASMTPGQRNKFNETWEKLYRKYFNKEDITNINAISESVAPYYYYKKRLGAKSNAVTIDIGGETTDAFVVNTEHKLLSSFRFAANAVFGDGYNWDAENNGFINKYVKHFSDILEQNKLNELKKVLDSILETKVSIDIVAFLFGLTNNKKIREKDISSLNFLEKLSVDSKLKYTIIIFFGAITYYIANLIKAKDLKMPNTIAFSGNGAKVLDALSPNKDTITDFVKLIFEKVFDTKYPKNNPLEIIFEKDNSKEATCKGGLLFSERDAQDYVNGIEHYKSALLGTDNLTCVSTGNNYDRINDAILEDVVKNVETFIDFIFEIDTANDNFFHKNFSTDASILDKVKNICKENLLEYAKSGLENKINELDNYGMPNTLDETLFFYPLVGMLNNLSRRISAM